MRYFRGFPEKTLVFAGRGELAGDRARRAGWQSLEVGQARRGEVERITHQAITMVGSTAIRSSARMSRSLKRIMGPPRYVQGVLATGWRRQVDDAEERAT